MLNCLGPIRLKESDFQRPKALLLLAYLALEGPQERHHLAELFWLGKAKVLRNLSSTLHRLNEALPSAVESDGVSVSTSIETDTQRLEAAASERAFEEVLELYQGPFAEGIRLKDGSTELEEWLYEKREHFAGLAREALLNLAEEQARETNYQEAAKRAAAAYHLRYAPEPEETELQRLYLLLRAANHLLAKEVRKEAPGYGLELAYSQEDAQAHFTKDEASQGTPHNLPESLSSFVGRQKELKALSTYLNQDDKRLISLVGLGGIGKTRLAVELAKEQLESARFKDGVYFVALDSLGDSYSIPFEIAEAMDLSLRGDLEPVELLTRQLKTKELLVVLDNYEHLLEAATLTNQLLAACPDLKLIITSRERLNVSGEWVYGLRGLGKGKTPEDVHSESAEAKQQADPYLLLQENPEPSYTDAIDLFYQRAQRADLGFELNEANREAIKEICQLVEGSPLAIELAASWVKLLSPEEIADEISQNLALLSTQARDGAERHQSIEAAFEYSWKRLNDQEQTLLRKLSVFERGFTREAAKEVASATLPLLASLADKSLIRPSKSGRFDLHPLIKQFLMAKLASLHEEDQLAKNRHAQFFLGLLIELRRTRKNTDRSNTPATKPRATRLIELASDSENVIAAWKWFIAKSPTQDFFDIAFALGEMFQFMRRYVEANKLFALAKRLFDENRNSHLPTLGAILMWQAWIAHEISGLADAISIITELNQHLAEEKQPHFAHSTGYQMLSNYQRKSGFFQEAMQHTYRALDYSNKLNLEYFDAIIWEEQGVISIALGNYAEAEKLLNSALEVYRKRDMPPLRALSLIHLGELAAIKKQYTKAKEILIEVISLQEATREMVGRSRCFDNLARVELDLGNLEQAEELAQEARSLALSFGGKLYEARALVTLGRIATAQNKLRKADLIYLKAIQKAHDFHSYSTILSGLVFLAEVKLKQDETDLALTWLTLAEQHESAEYWVKEKAREFLEDFKEQIDFQPSEYIVTTELNQVVADLL